jgi:hypothetical protein
MSQGLKICSLGPQVPGLQLLSEMGACFLGGLNEALDGLSEECDGVIIGISPANLDPQIVRLLANVHLRQIPGLHA